MTVEVQSGLGEFANWGFILELPDDHLMFLMHEGEQVAVFSQTGATEQSLQAECARHLALCHDKNNESIKNLSCQLLRRRPGDLSER